MREERPQRGGGLPHRVIRADARQRRPDEVEGEHERREHEGVAHRNAVDPVAEPAAVRDREHSRGNNEEHDVADDTRREVRRRHRPRTPQNRDRESNQERPLEPRRLVGRSADTGVD